MIVVVDYGAGNLRSVVNGFNAIGFEPVVTRDAQQVAEGAAVVLPGVGAFGEGMARLRALGLTEALDHAVMAEGKPFLGICLGLQFMGRSSEEDPDARGLGWIEGDVRRLVPKDGSYRVPHMGWNELAVIRERPLFRDIEDQTYYFVHSYHLEVDAAASDVIAATAWHGVDVTAAVQRDNLFGVQFHPEKSQRDGLIVLRNFVNLL